MRKVENIALKADEAEAIIRTLAFVNTAIQENRTGAQILIGGPTAMQALTGIIKMLEGKLNSGNGAPT
jgi:hypothetical protein